MSQFLAICPLLCLTFYYLIRIIFKLTYTMRLHKISCVPVMSIAAVKSDLTLIRRGEWKIA